MSLHLVNWNVNGIRAIIKKEFLENVKMMNPDVLCLQETKAALEEVKSSLAPLTDYKIYVNSSKARKGYSGTTILTKEEPLDVTYDMGIELHDQEGRVITAEFSSYFLVTVYTPNSGSELGRLDYREEWDKEFKEYLRLMARRKPVILCGDLNVAHQPIDLARPKENYNKSSGYTQREIDGLTRLLESGFVDTYRHFYPQEVKYTYWNYVTNARATNAGWRIDYFLVSNPIIGKVKDAMIYNQYHGSDHCPVAITLDV